jgi:hypothetical protein
MKNIIFLFIIIALSLQGFADPAKINGKWSLGLNLKYGKLSEKVSLLSPALIYPDTRKLKGTSALKINSDYSYGGDVQLGYYFGKGKNFGIGTGIVYFKNQGNMSLDSMHVEYRSMDFNQDTFRQLITTAKPIEEIINTTTISIPLVVKYRTMLSKKIGFMMDAGIVYNLKIESTYEADAAFNYEAIYKYDKINGDYKAVYDYSSIPNASDWLITVEKYQKDQGDGNEAAYLQSLQNQGYNVGLDEEITKKSGTVNNKTGSIGLLLQPSFCFKLSDVVFINLGAYYMYHGIWGPDANNNKNRITDKIGDYNSLLNTSIIRRQYYYGINLGLNFFL